MTASGKKGRQAGRSGYLRVEPLVSSTGHSIAAYRRPTHGVKLTRFTQNWQNLEFFLIERSVRLISD